MRLFIALVFPEDAQEHLRSQCRLWQSDPALRRARFASDFHITLQFLGEVPPNRLEPLTACLAEPYGGYPTFTVRLGALGAFPSIHRASILWQGVGEGGANLTTLANLTGEALAPLGFEPERRRFVPHATLARLRVPVNLSQWVARCNAEIDLPDAFSAGEVSLVQSILKPDGPLYTARASYPLMSV
ncbi:RNA 2',3'-cyclic phosphodiesterase [Candidatus Poribacteria bacterium]|nr:RNA 2',3'-cyclic phosphodiesterase [Candidatus Poribacteria bacterium]